ncbi:hypothetical protein Sps_05277 [Shewanella psychrophila]|uniref:Uncharacterized protein n=1 Tax=Shewanella psychrophila TaxID=225848 RepID=A0A1S6HXN3_9GAMM|nr:hypothetical protein [Shewanella psychrophila]AQS40346.1 hypothetical protein Sps_05277 [Shewanella psychrophila]
MKLLTSVALSAVFVFSSVAVADIPDFSKTSAAKSSYDFSKNQPVKGNQLQQASTRHDFSKTVAASEKYLFSINEAAVVQKVVFPSTQHDFSTTSAMKRI